MEKDNRLEALNKLIKIATVNGYITFDMIFNCADDYSLTIGEIDWLADMAAQRNIIISEAAPQQKQIDAENDFDDYAQADYEETYTEIIRMSNNLKPFINEIQKIKPPQWGEVARLKYQVKEGNQFARKRMIEMYLRLAIRIAWQRAKAFDLDIEETVGDACKGLIMAVDKYDPDFSGPFVSFASLWIYNTISREQGTKNQQIYYPVHRKEWYYTIYPLLKERCCFSCYEFPKCEEAMHLICSKMNCSTEDIEDIIPAFFPSISLQNILCYEYLNEDYFSNHIDYYNDYIDNYRNKLDFDYINKKYSGDATLEAEEFAAKNLLNKKINEKLNTLTKREKEVIVLRYGIKDGIQRTLEEVGERFGLTRERIRQIESKALKRLRSQIDVNLKYYID